SASSPSTNTAVCPRKCAATTGAAASTGRVRSTTEGMSARLSVMAAASHSRPGRVQRALLRARLAGTRAPRSREAAREAFPDLILRQLAADEDDAALALFILLPRPLMVAVEDHVHALKRKALVVILERENALAAQNIRPFSLHEILHPGEEFVGIERL